ncbi:hypothetical protein [Pragia fontium]|uniref:hypothetical protein n=1 Tax=Pragia fontium TaxID=82985 RepID=UPI00064A4055|nr:hypothetical protein [Pragia fontium]AKJ43171.1 hypothetical protein QQ39_14750 [Pragia fontium]
MKIKILLPTLIGMTYAAAALAVSPGNYDTRFNISAQVPGSAMITTPEGTPITQLDIHLIPSGSPYAAPATLSADTVSIRPLRLWSNSSSDDKVRLTLDDGNSATGRPFTLNSSSGAQLNKMEYKISTIDHSGKKAFLYSGAQHDYILTRHVGYAEQEIAFVFESQRVHNAYKPGDYSGVVYANVAVMP